MVSCCCVADVSQNGLVEGRAAPGDGSESGQQHTCSAVLQTCRSSSFGAGASPPGDRMHGKAMPRIEWPPVLIASGFGVMKPGKH